MPVRLTHEAFDPAAVAAEFQARQTPGAYGARVDFIGYLRDFNDDRHVQSMFLEHYPGMTEGMMARVCASAAARWEVQEILLVHRIGELHPGEPIVLVAVWSTHRADAFDACRYLISELKHSVPLWKREQSLGRAAWVTRNTPDPGA